MKEKNENYKKTELFFYNEKFLNIGKKIIDKDFKVLKDLKNTRRNYVALIEVNGEKFVYKEPRNEFLLVQRKIFTPLKKGEARTTLENMNSITLDLKKNFSEIYLAGVERKYGFIKKSFFLQEALNPHKEMPKEKETIALIKKIHAENRYHGDCNLTNFLKTDIGIKVIDTQLKKMYFGNYRAHYDMITLKITAFHNMKHPYKKNIFYYLAFMVKQFKNLKRRFKNMKKGK